ncbi:hypothetical protein Rhopal_000638-T1 [Rhodotorula paludigena]|uniref:Peptidase C45 hydrolase domain-containing protein n=1 Tax=Rhodotorula paludigena TaxID=86838 RepID=A0AAV5GGG5_9BASI|nr:hypothetical protein Rhopal_000638-T1 [Rhodotorula paludigena]
MTVQPIVYDVSKPFPVIRCTGSARERGRQHGQQAKTQVHGSINAYKSIFLDLAGLSWDDVLQKAATFEAPLRSQHPDLVEEMEGVADGAGVDFVSILALNVRSEISLAEPLDGCTSLSRVSSDGSRYIAQNWDWKTAIFPSIIVLHIEPDDGSPTIQMMTEAGIIGKMGHNASGVCLVMNAIKAKSLNRKLLPIHLLMRRILQQSNAAAARQYLESLPGCAASVHLMVADKETAFTLETSPKGFTFIEPDENTVLCHTNHFIDADVHRKSNEVNDWLADSPVRLAKIRDTLAQTPDISHERIRELLSDRSNGPRSICRHEGGTGIDTLFTITMNATDGSAQVKVGKPDEAGFVMDLTL